MILILTDFVGASIRHSRMLLAGMTGEVIRELRKEALRCKAMSDTKTIKSVRIRIIEPGWPGKCYKERCRKACIRATRGHRSNVALRIRTTCKANIRDVTMSMNFLDETDDWPEYQVVRDEIQRLESEHLEIQKALDIAESASRTAPADDVLRLKVDRLRARLKETQKKLDESTSMYR